MQKCYLAMGCFWKPEEKFKNEKGIIDTEVGYAGGYKSKVTYEEVCQGNTGHAEIVKLSFDENIISYEKILNHFFEIHNPTTLNKQGPDIGSQYRSEIFYSNLKQKEIAEKVFLKFNGKFNGKIVTKISEIKNYCKAEDYHQKYLEKNY